MATSDGSTLIGKIDGHLEESLTILNLVYYFGQTLLWDIKR